MVHVFEYYPIMFADISQCLDILYRLELFKKILLNLVFLIKTLKLFIIMSKDYKEC